MTEPTWYRVMAVVVAAATPVVGQSTINSWPTRCRSVIEANTRLAELPTTASEVADVLRATIRVVLAGCCGDVCDEVCDEVCGEVCGEACRDSGEDRRVAGGCETDGW